MIAIGDGNEMILHTTLPGKRQAFVLICFGRKRHYRKDGSCKHTEDVMARMKPWYRSRTKIDGWGGKTPPSISGGGPDA